MIVPLGVVDTSLLEDLSNDGDGGVDGVGNDQDVGLGAVPIIDNVKKTGLVTVGRDPKKRRDGT